MARLFGGLGNQMFQYAAARALADRLGTRLVLDIRHFPKQVKHTGYALGSFSIRAEPASSSDHKNWPNVLAELGLRMSLVRPFLRKWHFEARFTFDSSLAQKEGGVCLVGYWQSDRYFTEIADIIRRDLLLRDGLERLDRGLVALAHTADSVALHVRRGDYVHDPSTVLVHGTCSVDYYQRAIDMMRTIRPACHFLVFSDDPAWARRNLPLGAEAVFVEGNDDFPELDLSLMRECSHHIISNSTFSWWGAWLGKKARQVVIAPVPWFETDRYDSRDLLVADWYYLRRT